MALFPFVGKRAHKLPKGTVVRAIERKQLDDITGTQNASQISDQLGPGQPAAITPLDESGRPRQYFYTPGWNLPTAPGANRIDYDTLRQVADSYPLLRKCLEIRKNELARLPWSIVPRYGTPLEKRAQSKQNADKIRLVQKFFDKPDQRRSWQDWIRAALEDHFVIDAISINHRRTYGGKLVGLDLVDSGTIKVLLDVQGRIPAPPMPAYQQYIAGMARGEWTTKEFQYAVQNVRNHTPYGLSIVEANLSHFNLAMRWEAWTTAVFTDGSIPQALLAAPENFSREQIEDLMEFRRIIRQGDPKAQRDMEMLPHGVESIMSNGADGYLDFSSELVNYLIDMTGAFLDVTRQELGLDPSNSQGLGGSGRADAQENVQYRRSLLPLAKWLSDNIFTPILDEFGLVDFKWDWPTLTDIDPSAHSDMLEKQVKAGLITLDDALIEMGQDPQGIDRFIETSAGLLFIPDLKAMQKIGSKAYDTEQQSKLASQQAEAQNGQASHASSLKKGEAEHAHGLEKDKAEHEHGLGKDMEQHKGDIAQQQQQGQADVDQQTQAADHEHQMALAQQNAQMGMDTNEHKAGLDMQAQDAAHEQTMEQAEQAHGHASDLHDLQATTEGNQQLTQHELDQQAAESDHDRGIQAAEHGSGLKKDEAEHGSGLSKDEADHTASITEEAAHNDYNRQYDMAAYQQQLDQGNAEHQGTIAEGAAGNNYLREAALVNMQHGNAKDLANQQGDIASGQQNTQFAQSMVSGSMDHERAKEMATLGHDQKLRQGAQGHDQKLKQNQQGHRQKLQEASHGSQLQEMAAVSDHKRESAKLNQSAKLTREQTEHAARVQAKYPKPQPKSVKKSADLDFAFDAEFTPEFEQAALAHGTIATFPELFRQFLGEQGYRVAVSGAEASTEEGDDVAVAVDPIAKTISIFKSAGADDISIALVDAMKHAKGHPSAA